MFSFTYLLPLNLTLSLRHEIIHHILHFCAQQFTTNQGCGKLTHTKVADSHDYFDLQTKKTQTGRVRRDSVEHAGHAKRVHLDFDSLYTRKTLSNKTGKSKHMPCSPGCFTNINQWLQKQYQGSTKLSYTTSKPMLNQRLLEGSQIRALN